MKKLMKSLMLFAAAAMALTSCENEAMNEGIEANDTYTLNFVAGAPESKTSVTIVGNAANFAWGDNEEFVFIQHKDAVALGTNVEFTNNGETATISATFTGDVNTEYNHVAVYPASAWVDGTEIASSDFNSAKLTVKNKQELVNGTYDPTADLMVSRMVTCVPTEVPQALQFTRLVSVAEMNIKNLAVAAGEKITSVDFAVSESVIAGRNYYDLAKGEVVEYGYSDAYRSNNITLSGEGIDANSESVKVYFTCNPVTVATGETYTVTVTTDKAKYTKSATLSKDLAFEAGKVKAFGVNMTDAIKENLNDLSGTYIIVAKGSTNFYYMSTWRDGQDAITGGNNRSAVDSGVSEITDYTDSRVNFGDVDVKYVWNVTAVEGGYTFANNDNTAWLYLKEDNNRANMTTTEGSAGTFSIDKNNETNVFTVVDKTHSRTLAYNSGSSIFACYASGQNPALYFIPYIEDTRTAQNLSFGATTEFTITLGEEFAEPTLTGANTTVTYSSSDTDVATVANDGTVTIKAVGTTTITASAEANETFKAGTATYTITVKAAGAVAEPVTVEMSAFTATSAEMDAVVSYSTARGGGTSNPAINGTVIRLYQNAGGTGGGTITITAKEGYTLSSVTIGSSMGTSIAHTIGSSTTKSSSSALAANGKHTVSDINDSSITFHCMGTSSSTRLYVNYLSVTYVEEGSGDVTPDPTPDPEPTEIQIEVEENVDIANTEGEATIPVTVTNGEGYEFQATTTEDLNWIDVDWNNGVHYLVEANDTNEERTATVEIFATDGENEKTVSFTITQAAGESGGDEPETSVAIYTANFEGTTEHRTSGSNNYTSNSNTYTVSGVNWNLTYADAVTTGSPLDGSAHIIARVAKNTTNTPSIVTENLISTTSNISKVSFYASLGSNVTLTVYYSTNGTSWSALSHAKDTSIHASYGYSANVDLLGATGFYLKFEYTVSGFTGSNRDSKLDNVVIYN